MPCWIRTYMYFCTLPSLDQKTSAFMQHLKKMPRSTVIHGCWTTLMEFELKKWIVCQPSEQFYNSEELFNICHVGIFMFIRRSCTYLARSFDTIRYLKGVLQNITNYWYRGFLEEMFTDSELETWAKGGYQMQQKKGLMRGTWFCSLEVVISHAQTLCHL